MEPTPIVEKKAGMPAWVKDLIVLLLSWLLTRLKGASCDE